MLRSKVLKIHLQQEEGFNIDHGGGQLFSDRYAILSPLYLVREGSLNLHSVSNNAKKTRYSLWRLGNKSLD